MENLPNFGEMNSGELKTQNSWTLKNPVANKANSHFLGSKVPTAKASNARRKAGHTSSAADTPSVALYSVLESSFQKQLENAYDVVLEATMPIFDDVQRRKKLAETCMRKLLLTDLAEPSQIGNANLLNVADISEEPDYNGSLQKNGCKDWEKWEQARKEEMDAMEQFEVFEVVPRSSMRAGTRPLTAKWVHKVKVNELGEIVRWKARCVCRGFLQREFDTFHPNETYAPVVSHDALRLMLASATMRGLTLYQADISNFYLQCDLLMAERQSIYMEPPPGVDIGKDNIYLVKKPLYGSRQGAYDSSFALANHLTKLGFIRCTAEPSLYRRIRNGEEVIIAAYCDDLTIACKSDSVRDGIIAELRQRFVIKDGEGGRIRWLLGVKITQSIADGTTQLSQELAIDKVAKAFLTPKELLDSWKILAPARTEPLPKLDAKLVPDSEFHMLSALGSLIYISQWTRPDVSVAVSTLCRHAATPGAKHVEATKRLIQYLYRTRHLGLEYTAKSKSITPEMYAQGRHPNSTPHNHLDTFVDSDYAADVSRRSMKGVLVMFGGAPVMWSSSLNKIVSTSTAESEVLAAAQAAKDAIHLQNLLSFLGYPRRTIVLKEDNSAAIAQVEGGLKYVRKAKHYSVWLHFLQQKVLDKVISFEYTPTKLQLADVMTKNLPGGSEPGHFHYFADQIVKPVLPIPERPTERRTDDGECVKGD